MRGKKVKGKAKTIPVPYLPDEIITDILIRLPARDAMRCRFVCKRWRDLTLDRDFVDLNFRNSLPTILVVGSKYNCLLELFAIDMWWEPTTKRSIISHIFPFNALNIGNDSYQSGVLFSHAGLIVLHEAKIFSIFKERIFILNPARPNCESVTIALSKELQTWEIYGVYYHPSLKGYCSLWTMGPSSVFWGQEPNRIEYKILNLGSNPSLKTICNPFSNKLKAYHAIPLLINNHLYWKLRSEHEHKYDGHNDIMEFDVIREEFRVIPCPVPLSTECTYRQTHLLNTDGVLSFLLILPRKITIWRLEGHAEQLWTVVEYDFSMEIYRNYEIDDVIAIVDGKLAFRSLRRLRVCNLMEGTVRKYPQIAVSGDILCMSHQMSLASPTLSNGKTTIFIEQDDKMLVW